MATGIFINEIHYDNVGTDAGERIEVAGPAGTDMTGWSLVRYNGANGLAYATPLALSSLGGVIADQGNGFGTVVVAYPANGLQNGAPDGIALVDPDGVVVQFLSYEGVFTAVDGPAAGLTSTDIGIFQTGTEPLGSSLQLTGTGTQYEDFAWTETEGSNSFGAINAGQVFEGVSEPGFLVSPLTLATSEGGAAATLTVALATQPAADVTVTIAVPGADLTLSETTLVFTAADWSQPRQVTVTAPDDGLVEGPESVTINLAASSTDPDYAALAPAEVLVEIADALPLTAIWAIQGAGHSSALAGQTVRTAGIVTAVDSNGYYLQDAEGDGDDATSDAVFVFTSSRPSVAVGDAVQVTGAVSEFFPGGAATGNLSTTQIAAATEAATLILSSGNALPEAVRLGPDGRLPPTQVIEDDGFASFDPATDGIDFFESLEGMLVTVQAPVVVAPTNGFGEVWTVVGAPDGGLNATSLSERGTLNIEGGTGGPTVTNVAGGDFNPERIQIDDDSGILAQATPAVDVGARLTDVTGAVSYNFGNYEILPTQAYSVAEASTPERETTDFRAAGGDLVIASYNVENLDPVVEDRAKVEGRSADNVDDDIGSGRLDRISRDIVENLGTPDIVALQEVQDGDGAEISDVVSAEATLQALVDAIVAAGGPRYAFLDNPLIGNGTNGGQPGGNIRTAFLYNPERVDLVEDSLRTVTDPAAQQTDPSNPFFDSRLPLAADFVFQGETVTVVNNHLTSKGGSTPLFGAEQPPLNGSEEQRVAQAEALKTFVDGLLHADPAANIVLLGDLNEFEFEEPLQVLTGGADPSLANLTLRLPEAERYSYIFEGNSQSLDHILVSGNLAADSLFDAVHINSEFADQASDHDPLLALISLGRLTLSGGNGKDHLGGRAGSDLLDGGNGGDLLEGGGGADTLVGGNGSNLLLGGPGADLLEGGNGGDTLIGGAGDDTLIGGRGADVFVIGPGGGDDWLPEFTTEDRLTLNGGLVVTGAEEVDVDGDGEIDTLVMFGSTVSVALLGFRSSNEFEGLFA